MDNFVHLHAHTSIGSMQDAMTNVYDMFEKAAEIGQPALAITDHGTIAAAYDARKASKKHGVKYIPGCEAYFVDTVEDKKAKRRHIVLLAKNEAGYKNLLMLNWKGYQNFQYVGVIGKVFPRIDWKMLEEHHEGIVCLTACGSGLLSRQMFVYDEEDGEWATSSCHTNVINTVDRLKNIFGDDLYLELQPHNLKVYDRDKKTGEVKLTPSGEEKIIVDQNHINKKLIEAAKACGVKMVATADIHYLTKEDAKVHDMLMAISSKKPLSDPLRHRYEVEEFYMKTSGDIVGHFAENFTRKLAVELCNNSVEIANKCEDPVYLDREEVRFPRFDFEEEDDYPEFKEWLDKQSWKDKVPADHAFMRFRCIRAFRKKYGHLKGKEREEYVKRMKHEIKIYEEKNFCSYMLITSDFILKAKAQGIPVGPGRGSVGGSMVAHLLDIHMVDPIKYGLLFERFLNRQKTAFPDVDNDFSPDGRDWVKQYIVDRYGQDHVAHVSNLSRMTPKVVVKDVARSLELGGSKSEAFKIANKITESIPTEANTLEEAIELSPEFAKYVLRYPELQQYGSKLVGLEKAYATHAAGIVIGDIPLTTYVPLRTDKDGSISVQYEKNRCEAEGLIKIDLLGLEHLRIIDNCIKNARALGMDCPDTDNVPFDDEEVWSDISKGKTMCVFQMESSHMRALCKQIKPRSIEDLSLVNALGRPSAKKSRLDYIARRDGKQKVTYKYECLRPALQDTLGICVYEEQLAKLANVVAGWDMNKADGLRKLTKLKEKGKELAEKLKQEFINDSIAHSGLKKEDAQGIWEEIIEPFAGYGFNKAHGILYSINGYHSAYYKHYFPAAFMAAVLKSEVEKASSPTRDANISLYKREAKRLKLKIQSPDINRSGHSFTVLDGGTIVTGLEAIKGCGSRAVDDILQNQKEHKFRSFADFLYRTTSQVVKKDVIQALAKAGCFDSLSVARKTAFEHYADIRTAGLKHAKKVCTEGRDAWDVMSDFEYDMPIEEWDKETLGKHENDVLGEYVSVDINDVYGGFFTGKGVTPFNRLKKIADKTAIRVEAVIQGINQRKIKSGSNKGRQFGTCSLTDANGDAAELTAWPEHWNKHKEHFVAGRPIRAICKINIYKGNTNLVLDRLEGVGEVK